MVKGTTNSLIAFPYAGLCVYDYISTLRPLTYQTDEYTNARSKCHERTAERILYLSATCGGIYFKAGQYIGTLERVFPKEYTDRLKKLQD